ncbi:MAG: flagellar biosynthesis protein FlhF [Gammaproteobacteria bacterium]|nr:flagellar biosynthesis protein FlhF [Gammaproteobacteria bacterium]
MKIKRYFAADMRQALQMVREGQGPDAVILSNRKLDGGVEIVAAVDYDEALVERMTRGESKPSVVEPPARKPAQAQPSATPARPSAGGEGERRSAAANRIVWSQDPAISAMRDEIKTLRGLVETQLTGIAWGEARQHQPLRVQVLERLTRLGLSARLCNELAGQVRYQDDAEHNWRQALGQLARRIPVTHDDILSRGGVVALVGPTGVGKTTSVAKLAARYTLRHGPDRVALITTDSYRIGAQQQLRTFGRLLNAPVYVANDAAELAHLLETLRNKSLVLIDTAGTSQRDVRLAEQAALLNAGGGLVHTYVVLSATTQRKALEETVRAFGNIALDGCLLTKLDETASLGEALSVVAEQQLPVAYVSDGQRVPEDLQTARANNLVTRSVGMMRHSDAPVEEALAFSFGGLVSNANG